MQTQSPYKLQPRPMSPKMGAVLAIFDADPLLAGAAFSAIDLEKETVDWTKIFKRLRGTELREAAEWAFCIWTDTVPAKSNPFHSAIVLERKLRRAILKALAIHWGLSPIERHVH